DPPLKSAKPLCSDRFRLLQDFRRQTARRQGNGRFSPELQPAAALSGMSPGEGRPDARSGRHAVVASILFHPPAPVPNTKYTLTSPASASATTRSPAVPSIHTTSHGTLTCG